MRLCAQSFYRGGCFLLSGAEIVFVEELESHINSSGTCQQPPSSSDVTFSSPEITRGFREQKASACRTFHPTSVRNLSPEPSSSRSWACPHSAPHIPLVSYSHFERRSLTVKLRPVLQLTDGETEAHRNFISKCHG